MQLVRKSLTLLTGEAGARALGILTFALLARALSLPDFGTFSFATSAALMLAVFIDMGQNSHLVRLASRDPDGVSRPLQRVLLNKALFGVMGVLGVSLALRAVGFSAQEVTLVALMGVWATVLSMLDSLRAVVRALGMMGLDSAVNGLESLGRLLAVLLAWVFNASVEVYAAAFIIEALTAVIVFSVVMSGRATVHLDGEWSSLPRVLNEAWALGVMGVAMAGFYRVDQVLVQGLAGAAENGLYGAATRIAFTATVGSAIVLMAGYPELSRAAASGRRYGDALRRVLLLSLGIGSLAAVVVFAGADLITTLLYGSGFDRSVPILRILSLVVFAHSATVVGMYSASALGRERRAVRLALGMIAANLGANALLIPALGAIGAAWVSAVGEILIGLGMLWISRDFFFPRQIEGASAAC